MQLFDNQETNINGETTFFVKIFKNLRELFLQRVLSIFSIFNIYTRSTSCNYRRALFCLFQDMLQIVKICISDAFKNQLLIVSARYQENKQNKKETPGIIFQMKTSRTTHDH